MADHSCIPEMKKILDILYKSKLQYKKGARENDLKPLEIGTSFTNLKIFRALRSEIVELGAEIHDLLGGELLLGNLRGQIISKPLEVSGVQRMVSLAITQMKAKLDFSKDGIRNCHADEANLIGKIEKKKVELERCEKRLISLQGVRPAYMDEYERLEAELVIVYASYMKDLRNLAFLEQKMDQHDQNEQQKLEQVEVSLKKMQLKLKDEEMRLLRDEGLEKTYRRALNGDEEGGVGISEDDLVSLSSVDRQDDKQKVAGRGNFMLSNPGSSTEEISHFEDTDF